MPAPCRIWYRYLSFTSIYCALNPFCIYVRSLGVGQSSVTTLPAIRQKAVVWLRQGISPRRLALTLVLGFVMGCIPVVGLPTALCAVIALAFRLNQPAIQAANYVAMPFQVALILPFVRLGGKLIPFGARTGLDFSALSHMSVQVFVHAPQQLLVQLSGLAGQALLAWMLLAIPVVVVLTPALTLLLRRVPALAAAESGD
jgi:uncharacterized protein (DUF2062 family)